MNYRRIGEICLGVLFGGVAVAVVYEAGFRSPDCVDKDVAEASPAKALDDAETVKVPEPREESSPIPEPSVEHPPEDEVSEVPRDPKQLAFTPDEDGHPQAFPDIFGKDSEESPIFFDENLFPLHGLVLEPAVVVRSRADLQSPMLGILRAGARLRTQKQRVFGGGCQAGWYSIFPQGFICMKAELKIGETPPDDGLVDTPQPRIHNPLPYDYWRVNHDATPFFHRLPSFGEQDLADTAGKAWLEENGRTPMPTTPSERPETVPAVVKEYLNSGYYVTVAGEAVKSQRRFLRTLRGVFARKYQLEQREGSTFQGIVLASSDDLPVYWIARETGMFQRKEENSEQVTKVKDSPPRRSRHPFQREVVIAGHAYYEDAEGLLMPTYAVDKSRLLRRPSPIGSEETWVHVDLSEQTLVAYRGDQPVFTTLVSTGKEVAMTPVGIHRVQSKHIATSMRDQPMEDEAYSIEDVPWTQYFHNSVALHGAFWHGGFGLVRSHGCVNISPADARWLFGFTEPKLPEGWHSIYAGNQEQDRGSAVVITE